MGGRRRDEAPWILSTRCAAFREGPERGPEGTGNRGLGIEGGHKIPGQRVRDFTSLSSPFQTFEAERLSLVSRANKRCLILANEGT